MIARRKESSETTRRYRRFSSTPKESERTRAAIQREEIIRLGKLFEIRAKRGSIGERSASKIKPKLLPFRLVRTLIKHFPCASGSSGTIVTSRPRNLVRIDRLVSDELTSGPIGKPEFGCVALPTDIILIVSNGAVALFPSPLGNPSQHVFVALAPRAIYCRPQRRPVDRQNPYP